MDNFNTSDSEDEESGVNSDTAFPLLKLITSPGLNHISDLLISFVSTGECGPMSILNLRKVSKDTKHWVDNLRPALSKRVYDQIIAHVNLSNGYEESEDGDTEESENSDDSFGEGYRIYFDGKTDRTFEKFKAFPTPPGVTSLRLKHPEHLLESNEGTVDFFRDFWSKKLEYLELKNYNDGVLELFKTAPLRVLHIETMESWPDSDSKFYQIEEISMRWGSATDHVSPMTNNTNLKRFYTGYGNDDPDDEVGLWESDSEDEQDIDDDYDVDYVEMKDLEALISSKSNDTNFRFIANPVIFRFKDATLSKKFISTVANSKSTIRLSLKDRNVEKIQSLTSPVCAKNFFQSVEDIWCYYGDNMVKIRQLFGEGVFPNLKRLKENRDFSHDEILKFLDAQTLPQGLEFLETSSTFLPCHLPKSLTYLNLWHQNLTPLEWQNSIFDISESCTSLKKLSIAMVINSPIRPGDITARENQSFKNLKTFCVAFRVTFEGSAESLRIILLNIFQVHEMQIQRLSIQFYFGEGQRIHPCLDDELYNALSSSPLAKSLTEFSNDTGLIDERTCTTALHDFQTAVEKNKRSRRLTHGHRKKRNFEHDRFHFLEEAGDGD